MIERMSEELNRIPVRTMSDGIMLWRVRLVGGPCDGRESLTTGDEVWCASERYIRNYDDNFYYHTPAEGALA